MTKKYIVKNCPSVSSTNSKDPLCYECNNRDYGEDWRCMDRDCLIKQVVEKCKKYNSDLALTGYQQGKEDFANEILQLFEIMELKNRKLEAENERLKQAFAESDNDCFRLEKENNLLKVYRSITPLKVKKLVQTLVDIKEIVEKPITTIKNTERECYGDAEWSELRGKCALARQILNKINEVDDESYLDNHWLFTENKKGEN